MQAGLVVHTSSVRPPGWLAGWMALHSIRHLFINRRKVVVGWLVGWREKREVEFLQGILRVVHL